MSLAQTDKSRIFTSWKAWPSSGQRFGQNQSIQGLTAGNAADILANMKTIAMTIDEPTLKRIDRLMASQAVPWKSRSEVIRHAVQQFITDLERANEEEREREIFRRHGARLNRQAAALIKEQAQR